MRGFLILLAVAFPILVFSPSFWWLVQSEVDAAPGLVIEQDGAARPTLLGPRAPWPEWALAPEGALTPRAHIAAAPGHPAQGHGQARIETAPEIAIAALKARLAAHGWRLQEMRYRVAEPTLPPTPVTLCAITARRTVGAGEQTLVYGFEIDAPSRDVLIHWIEGAPLPAWPSEHPPAAWTQPRPAC